MKTISKREYIASWIAKNFDTDFVKIDWKENNAATVTDRNGDSLEITMPDRTLYADGKPFGGIPSLVDVAE